MRPDKAMNIARGVFGILAGILALITIILFGANMDYANFPGANLKIAEHTGDKEGQLKQVVGGWELEPVSTATCSNFVNTGTDDAISLTFGADVTANQLCKNTEDPTKNLNTDWTNGWVVAPDCARTTDENECAPFGTNSPLAWFGFLTFIVLSLQVVLYGAHTCYLLVNDALGEEKLSVKTMRGIDSSAKVWLGLTIVWLIIGFALMITSALGWTSLCDKIDTGLGRQVNTGDDASPDMVRACATTACGMSFGSFFATFIVSIVWYRLPHIAQWFGFLEAV